MAVGQISIVLQQLRYLLLEKRANGATDESLLESFQKQQDEAAFEALVQRHGPMVLGVCRRILENIHDAEDAFQATFLILVRKATSIRPKSMVGSWLYGVACRTALNARRAAARRRAREAAVLPRMQPADQDRAALWSALDEELQRLPARYRAVIVLSDLEGKTRKEVAQHLGWPEGTVASRLARARARLAKRLARQGFAVSGTSLAMLLPEGATSAAVPASLALSTVRAASLVATGQAVAGVAPSQVAALMEGALRAMLRCKIWKTTALLLFVMAVGAATGLVLSHADGTKTEDRRKEPKAPALPTAPNQRAMTHHAMVRCVAFSPDGKTLASGADDRGVKLWDVATGNERAVLQGHSDGVLSLAYSPDGKTLASVSKDTVKLWDTGTGKEWATLTGHTEGCSVVFSRDGKTLAEGSKDRTIKLWDVQARKVRTTLRWRKDWLSEQVAPLPKEEALVLYSADGRTLASGNVDRTIHLWDVETGKERLGLTEHVGPMSCLAFSPDSKTLASAGGPINLWDVQTGKQKVVLFGPVLHVLSLAFSPDGKTLAAAGQGKTIALWDVPTGKERAPLTEQTNWGIASLAFSPDGQMLASACEHYLGAGPNWWRGTIRLWDMAGSD